MNFKNQSVEVVKSDISQHPYCPHGPTLLFSSNSKTFYACSSCRRNECNFYMLEEEWLRKSSKKLNEKYKNLENPVDHERIYQAFALIKQSPEDNRYYCHTCDVLVTQSTAHKGHTMKTGLSDELLAHPTKWLPPLNNDTKEAQYYFVAESISVIMGIIKKNYISHVICVGTPRIHEHIQSTELNMTSVLLDIDQRHYNFNVPGKFYNYNMFNDYFFNGPDARNAFLKHVLSVRSKKCCIVMDPPFGGRTEPLAQTLRTLSTQISNTKGSVTELIQELIPSIWVFPYFSEAYIRNELPEFSMGDYQVKYQNHKKFSNTKKRKTDNPVRIFTNMELSKIDLSGIDGYHFCSVCDRWVGDWNRHCDKCLTCSSKSGSSYVHCDICNRCVKPTFVHCDTCQRCALRGHDCGLKLPRKKCFRCGEYAHKQADCHSLTVSAAKAFTASSTKRKATNAIEKYKSKIGKFIK